MTFTPTDSLPYDFANRRHIGPSPAEMEEMQYHCRNNNSHILVTRFFLTIISYRCQIRLYLFLLGKIKIPWGHCPGGFS